MVEILLGNYTNVTTFGSELLHVKKSVDIKCYILSPVNQYEIDKVYQNILIYNNLCLKVTLFA